MKITLNKILFAIWLSVIFLQRNNSNSNEASNTNFLKITGLLITISIINWWVSETIEQRKRLEKQGGVDPWEVYRKYVYQYYYMSGETGGWNLTSLSLPTPFDSEYYNYKKIWTESGYWQDEWKAFCLGLPSVYNQKKKLPLPWRGPTMNSISPSLYYKGTEQEINLWRNWLLNNTFPF
jgi:hypothetical protein